MSICPCCGTPIHQPVSVSLDTNVISTAIGSAKLEPKCVEVVEALLRKFPGSVRFDTLGLAIWGQRYWDLTENAVRVQVCKTRRAIAPLGLEIHSATNAGYRLAATPTETGDAA